MGIELLNMDCEKYMSGLPDKAFSIAAVDPPYGINGNSHRKNKNRGRLAKSKDYHMALWDQQVPSDRYFDLLFAKSMQQLVFGGNYFKQLTIPHDTPRREFINDWIEKHPFGWIAWDKCNGTTGFNDYELIWTSFKHMPTFVYKYMWNGFMQGRSIENGHQMNPIKYNNEVRIHPAHKPVNLYKFLYTHFSQWTGKILDTHLGGGSSAIAAYNMQLDFVGCEIDETYFKQANIRFAQQTAQQKLFI